MPEFLQNPLSVVYRREVARFLSAAGVGPDGARLYRNRRSAARHHRSCPLLVTRLRLDSEDVRADLHDVSAGGIGFFCAVAFPLGTLLGIKLFWSEADAPRIPAVVRHTRRTRHGLLVGAAFALEDPAACRLAERQLVAWYG